MIVDDPYKALGVRKAINAAGILTRIGGSRSPPEVFRAMKEARRRVPFDYVEVEAKEFLEHPENYGEVGDWVEWSVVS